MIRSIRNTVWLFTNFPRSYWPELAWSSVAHTLEMRAIRWRHTYAGDLAGRWGIRCRVRATRAQCIREIAEWKERHP